MTNEEKELVQSSFAEVMLISGVAAELFYNRLFELDPKLRMLFKSDMREQGRRLMQMIEVAVKGLDQLDALLPALKALGSRHAAYGVCDQHYETVGAAFIDTLEKGLGPAFTPNVRKAWITVYTMLASVMQTAAKESVVASV